ncbi:MAG: DEAD/DEAH box helicase [Rhodospirillales bacterium]|jgi:superfamily II DNA/RNA helicase
MSFDDLGLGADVLRAVADAGYKEPTPIQRQAIPQVLSGRDILGCAQTGTGKTASFTLPMIEVLQGSRARARMPRSLILEPTRELAAQVAENFDVYGKYHKLTKALLIGGVQYGDQEKVLDRGVDVLIATPGRLLDHFERGRLLLSDVKMLVIDEADRMLDMGFIPDVERIVSLLPKHRQTLFFSATMPPEIRRLADAFLVDPKEITVARPATTADTVKQSLVTADERVKREVLRALLRAEPVRNALIFCNRKRDVDMLHKSLRRHGFNVGQLHGDMDQAQRTATLESFKRGEITLLVCSDVAARGLDIDDLSHVFNFDVPIHAEDYVHRIGRTGRAGRSGAAFTIATRADGKFLAAIEKLIGKPIPRAELPGFDAAEPAASAGEPSAAPAPAPASATDAEAPRQRSRGRRGGRERDRDREQPRGGDRPAQREQTRPAEPQEERPRAPARPDAPPPRPAPAARSEQPPRRRRPDTDDDQSPLGLGDHVPAFLMRGKRASG